ncbi:MAG TPA: SUF system NifU family Fe-S cluster assembly protein [Gemmatimonadaceae bacterium]|nr:SUF system NifU family Fe-S cluster assembly protein [Gemmatimonadaceae bacterium]
MESLDALYQELILEHNRKPKNFRVMDDADQTVEGRNPLCGDELTVWLKFSGDHIDDVSFRGSGCAISKASASLMTSAVKGKTRAEALDLFERFHRLVTGQLPADEERALGPLRALGGVSRFPLRVKCASLAWHALRSGLIAEPGTVPEVNTEKPSEGTDPAVGPHPTT